MDGCLSDRIIVIMNPRPTQTKTNTRIGVVWVSKRTPYRRASVVQKRVVVQGVYGHLEMEEVRVLCLCRCIRM